MRAQISLEFIIVMALGVSILVGLLYVGVYQLDTALTDWRLTSIEDVGQSVQQELITAQRMQDGYTRTFTLPEELTNEDYTITLQTANNVTAITLRTDDYQLTVRTPACSGTLQPGRNVLRKENSTLWCNT